MLCLFMFTRENKSNIKIRKYRKEFEFIIMEFLVEEHISALNLIYRLYRTPTLTFANVRFFLWNNENHFEQILIENFIFYMLSNQYH